ncbi:MAG: ATP-grasp domain-containing protein [Candidatus Azotimanducaceae bacterium]
MGDYGAMKLNVLVTGIAGDIGFGVCKILRRHKLDGELYGIDIHSNHPGNIVCNVCAVAPRADAVDYIDWMKSFVTKNKIDLIIPTSEAEIGVLVSHKIRKIAGAGILINHASMVEICLDKYRCIEYLKNNDLEVPDTGLLANSRPSEYPVVLKPRAGRGSKDVKIVSDEKELPSSNAEKYVWQEYLKRSDEEYTCGVFWGSDRTVRNIILRRRLENGMTASGEVVEEPLIEKYISKVVNLFEPPGCFNIQLRLTDNGPRLFEINPRLSSTLVFRDLLGFQDLIWWIKDSLAEPFGKYEPPPNGVRFYRGSNEYLLSKHLKSMEVNYE